MKSRKQLSIGIAVSLAGTFAFSHTSQAQEQDGGNVRPRRQRGAERETVFFQLPDEFDQQAKTILDKTAVFYRNLKSFQVEQAVYSGRPAKTVIAEFQEPKNFRVTDIDSKGTKTTSYYNYAVVTITHVRDFGNKTEYQVDPFDEFPVEPRTILGRALGPYYASFLNRDNVLAQLPPIETVKYGGVSNLNGIPVESLVLTLRARGQRPAAVVTYYIGQYEPLLHKVTRSSVSADGTPVIYSETYNQKVNIELPENTFQLNLPAGAVEVDQLSRFRGKQVADGDTPFPISGQDTEGKEISLEQYKGKVVLLDFWATWCAPCRAELPNLKAAYAKYKDQGFEVVGISLDETAAPLKPFIAKESLNWRNIYDGF